MKIALHRFLLMFDILKSKEYAFTNTYNKTIALYCNLCKFNQLQNEVQYCYADTLNVCNLQCAYVCTSFAGNSLKNAALIVGAPGEAVPKVMRDYFVAPLLVMTIHPSGWKRNDILRFFGFGFRMSQGFHPET